MNPATQGLGADTKKRARAHEADWRLEPHVCRICFGRIASHAVEGGLRRYECAQCGLADTGNHPRVVCGCGIKLRKGGGLVDAGIRCHENEHPSPDFPSRYVCSHVGEGAP